MLEFRTQGFNGYAVQYSPFFDSRIAVASAANFGLVGNGRLYILGLTPKGIIAEKWYIASPIFPPTRVPSSIWLTEKSFAKGLTRKIPSTTSAGPNRTRTSAPWPPATAPSSCSM